MAPDRSRLVAAIRRNLPHRRFPQRITPSQGERRRELPLAAAMAHTSTLTVTLDLTSSSPADGAEFAAPLISYNESGVGRKLSGVSNEASSRGTSSSSSSTSSSPYQVSTYRESAKRRRRRYAAAMAAAKGRNRTPRGDKKEGRRTRGLNGRSESA